MPALLLLSCSNSKRLRPGEPIAAIERYTGIFFQVFKKWRREHPRSISPDLLIISGQFGLLTPETPIPYYDQRMTAARAAILRSRIQDALKRQLLNHAYRHILVKFGRDYLPALEGFTGLRGAAWA